MKLWYSSFDKSNKFIGSGFEGMKSLQKSVSFVVIALLATVALVGVGSSGRFVSASPLTTTLANFGHQPAPPPVKTPPPTPAIVPTVPAGTSVPTNVAFDDEFNKGSLNTSVWSPYWFANGDTSNNTVMKSSNVSVDSNGLELKLATNQTGALVSTNPDDYVTGHTGFQVQPTVTNPVFIEYKAQLPGSGNKAYNWPALWATGQNWPQTGELDLMEGFGNLQAHTIYSGCGNLCNPSVTLGNWSAGYHTFGVLLTTTSTTFYFDGKNMGGATVPYTLGPLYLIMENSLASSGRSTTPATMTVRYARVWQ